MSFNYEKNKQQHSGDNFWTSYSDLFLGLSTIFLLLYVTASLRTGTDSLHNQVENQKLTMENEELKNQLKIYEQVKTDYLQHNASKNEIQQYKELMDKLTLLKEDAKNEKEKLVRQAMENDLKAKALNQYQQMVRNIINANELAKAKIVHRNGIIEDQDQTIGSQKKDIASLQSDISTKKQLIQQGQEKIQKTEAQLKENKRRLYQAYRSNKISKKKYLQERKTLLAKNQRRLNYLRGVNQKYNAQLAQASTQLNQLSSELSQTQNQLNSTQTQLGSTQNQLSQTQSQLNSTQGLLANTTNQLQQSQSALKETLNQAKALQSRLGSAEGTANALRGQIASIKSGYAAQKAKDKAAFEAALSKQRLNAKQRAAKEAAFRAAAAAKQRGLQAKLAGLQGQLKDTEGDLAKAKSEIDDRRRIARQIKDAFRKAGVKADIDMQTGQVVLDFGDAYFESDSAHLKPRMKEIIEKAMPAYSKSLFGNPQIAKKISSVEIIGFASPTYKGRYVDPYSTKPEDKAALKYNMDLSYRRANSIFNYLIDDKSTTDTHHQKLLSLMKVSGRSFLQIMKVNGRSPASAAEFCKVNDCKKAQKVIIRFSMEGK